MAGLARHQADSLTGGGKLRPRPCCRDPVIDGSARKSERITLTFPAKAPSVQHGEDKRSGAGHSSHDNLENPRAFRQYESCRRERTGNLVQVLQGVHLRPVRSGTVVWMAREYGYRAIK